MGSALSILWKWNCRNFNFLVSAFETKPNIPPSSNSSHSPLAKGCSFKYTTLPLKFSMARVSFTLPNPHHERSEVRVSSQCLRDNEVSHCVSSLNKYSKKP